ncbi:MAG TPA: GGDEF domain-containing protein, partial [Euzebya sp.]|nr:GGDEF domain-containing protein [Euzebya sp.]
VGHVVSGIPASSPSAEVHWQVDCLPLDSPTEPGALLLIVNDITARTRAMRSLNEQRRALAYQASHDPVTGLANRFQLLQFLQYQLSGDRPPTVMLVDLDGFKEVNDEHGHAAGDHVLATVADRLREAVDAEDLVARYGGDEFVVVARPGEDAADLCQRLQEVIGQPIAWSGRPLVVGASIGWSEGKRGDSVSGLLNRADERMYRVKERRRRPR